MDIQQVAAQLISYLGSDPDKIAQFAQHPYSTTAKVAGTDETISQKDMSRVVAQVAAQSSGQELGTDATKSLASALLGESGGSVHALTNALFGGAGNAANAAATTSTASAGPSMAEIMAKSVAGGLAARGLAALLTNALGTNKNAAGK